MTTPALALKDPHAKGTLSSLNAGILFESLIEKRGVIFYRDFQVDPGLTAFFFDDRLEFLDDSLTYRDFVYGKSVRLRTKIAYVSDRPFFPAYGSVSDSPPLRTPTYEWSNSVEIFLPAYDDDYRIEIDLTESKDVAVSQGNEFEVLTKLKLFSGNLFGTTLEPNLVLGAGWGDTPMNAYFYGPNAGPTGINHFDYGFWLALPELSDRYYPIVQVMHFQTLGDANRAGTFAVNRNEGFLFSFIASVRLLN